MKWIIEDDRVCWIPVKEGDLTAGDIQIPDELYSRLEKTYRELRDIEKEIDDWRASRKENR